MLAVRVRPIVTRVASARPSLVFPIRPARALTIRNFTEGKDKASDQPSDTELAKQPQQTLVRPPLHRHGHLSSLIGDMQRDMDALTRAFGFGDMWEPFGTSRLWSKAFTEPTVPSMRLATDIKEDDKSYTIMADVPGMSKEDIKVQLKDNVLHITGERKQETKHEEEGGATWTERSYGTFARSFRLPEHVDPEGIKASCDQGVLTLVLPKKPEPKPQVQEIAIE